MTEYVYDGLGRACRTVSALGYESSQTYDAMGRLTCSVDARENETSYEYDLIGRLMKDTDPYGNVTAYSYVLDALGRAEKVTGKRGNAILSQTSYEYLRHEVA
jgi:YD repeat-containing protein